MFFSLALPYLATFIAPIAMIFAGITAHDEYFRAFAFEPGAEVTQIRGRRAGSVQTTRQYLRFHAPEWWAPIAAMWTCRTPAFRTIVACAERSISFPSYSQ